MAKKLRNIIKSGACLLLMAGTISACSTMVAPDEDGTTEYVFKQGTSDQVLSKADDSITSGKSEED